MHYITTAVLTTELYFAGDTVPHNSASMNGSSSTIDPPSTSLTRLRANSELLKTPPKRKTARKHTGRLFGTLAGATCTSTSPQSKVASMKTSNSDDVISPPAKKRRTVRPTGSRQENSDSHDTKCVESETEKCEEEGTEKTVGSSETVEQDTELVTDKLGGTGEKKEAEGAVTELSTKPEETEAGEDMEVSEEEKGQSVQEQVTEKKSTPKRGSKAGGTPGSGKKSTPKRGSKAGGTPGSGKKSTPKRGSKAGGTPGSGKKKATHPFFSE